MYLKETTYPPNSWFDCLIVIVLCMVAHENRTWCRWKSVLFYDICFVPGTDAKSCETSIVVKLRYPKTCHPKRHSDPIRRFSTMHWTDTQTHIHRHTDGYRKWSLTTLCLTKRPPFSYDCSFYNCWPVFEIFDTRYMELMCNITVCYLPTSPTYCCYITLGNRATLHVDAQKLMPYLCQDARASFSSVMELILMAVIIMLSNSCSRCCHPFVLWLVTLTHSSKTVHQRIRARQTIELIQRETP